ncbi:MAG: cbb3-type cytochrome c oxidase subunit I [Nitrospirota bacterium]
MDRTSVWFIKAGMIYFLVSSIVGVSMAVWPEVITYYRAVHAHLNLLGWMTMMIFGIGYHILPIFSGRPLHSPSIARTQFWLANIGLIGMALSWAFIYHGRVSPNFPRILLSFFGSIEVLAVFLFIYNMWKTIRVVEPMKAS